MAKRLPLSDSAMGPLSSARSIVIELSLVVMAPVSPPRNEVTSSSCSVRVASLHAEANWPLPMTPAMAFSTVG